MRTVTVAVLILILAGWLHFVGQSTDRNTASLGALWARVDSLEAAREAR